MLLWAVPWNKKNDRSGLTAPLLSAPTRWALRGIVVVVLLLVAFKFVGDWWFWEHRVTMFGFPADRAQRTQGRVALIWAAATLAAALSMWELLDDPPRLSRRFLLAAGAAALLAAMALVAGHLT